MAVTVVVNERTIIHRNSEGQALGVPDVCKTPQSFEPVPYANLALSKDLDGAATTVFADGCSIAKQSSWIARSTGDEPGTEGGVISGCNRGKASWLTYSPDVMIEGEYVPRALDLTAMNHGSPANSFGWWIQNLSVLGATQIVCVAICSCQAMLLKMWCFKKFMSSGGRDFLNKQGALSFWTPQLAQVKQGYGAQRLVTVYEPRFPGIYPEVSFRQLPSGRWQVVHSDQNTTGHPPLPIPAGEWIPNTKRPDVVVAKDPTKPLTRDNIKEIIEVKFIPGDEFNEDQTRDYNKLVPGVRVKEVSNESCGCSKVDWSPKGVRQRVEAENLQPKAEEVDGECSEPEESVDLEPVSPKAPVDSLPPWLTPLFDWARRPRPSAPRVPVSRPTGPGLRLHPVLFLMEILVDWDKYNPSKVEA